MLHGEALKRVCDPETAPTILINNKGVWIDGEPFPLIVATEPIEITEHDGHTEIRLSLISCGKVEIADDVNSTTTTVVTERSVKRISDEDLVRKQQALRDIEQSWVKR